MTHVPLRDRLVESAARAIEASVRKVVEERFAHHPGHTVEVLGVSDDGKVEVKIKIPALFPIAETDDRCCSRCCGAGIVEGGGGVSECGDCGGAGRFCGVCNEPLDACGCPG